VSWRPPRTWNAGFSFDLAFLKEHRSCHIGKNFLEIFKYLKSKEIFVTRLNQRVTVEIAGVYFSHTQTNTKRVEKTSFIVSNQSFLLLLSKKLNQNNPTIHPIFSPYDPNW